MALYYFLLLGLAALWAVLCIGGRTKLKDRIFLILAFGVLAFLAAARYDLGYDYTYVYAPQYEQMLTTPGYTFSDTRFEPGFVLLEKAIASFSNNYHMLFVVTGILTMGLFFVYYWFNAPNPFLAVFFFITLSQYYCTLDFMRQSIAAGILMVGFPLLKKRKVLPYLAYLPLILLASTFHKSALVMLAFLLVNLLPLNNKWVLGGFSAATVVLYLNTDRIMKFVTQYWYGGYSSEAQALSFEPHFAVAMLVIFLILLAGSKLLIEQDSGNYLYVNYAFFTFFFVLLGTRHHILDRLSMYFMFALPVGLSILFDALNTRYGPLSLLRGGVVKMGRKKVTFLLGMVVVFAGSLSLHHYALSADHHGVAPYKLIWNQPFYAHYKEWIQGMDDEPAAEIDFGTSQSE